MIYWFILDNWLIGTDADALLLTTASISIMCYNANGFLCIYRSHLLILFWNSLCELKTGFLSVKAADMLLIFGLNAIITSLGFVVLVWELVSVSCSVVLDSLQPHGLQPIRVFCPWDFPGKDPGVGCYFLLQMIFPTQGSNLDLLHCRQILHHLSYEVWEERS